MFTNPRSLSISITAIAFLISAIIYTVFYSQAKEAKASKKKNLWYLILSSLLFLIVGLSGHYGEKHRILFFNLHQITILAMGILHVLFMRKILPWTGKVELLWRLVFVMNIGFFGIFFLMFGYMIIGFKFTSLYILTTTFWLLVPFFFVEAVEKYLKTPGKIYKKWYFPVDKRIPDPKDSEFVSMIIVRFRLKKKESDPEPVEITAKAPQKMQFSRLYYFCIKDYNERNPQEAIEFLQSDGEPSAWVFNHQSGNIMSNVYIDPDLSVENNRLQENSIINCTRIKTK